MLVAEQNFEVLFPLFEERSFHLDSANLGLGGCVGSEAYSTSLPSRYFGTYSTMEEEGDGELEDTDLEQISAMVSELNQQYPYALQQQQQETGNHQQGEIDQSLEKLEQHVYQNQSLEPLDLPQQFLTAIATEGAEAPTIEWNEDLEIPETTTNWAADVQQPSSSVTAKPEHNDSPASFSSSLGKRKSKRSKRLLQVDTKKPRYSYDFKSDSEDSKPGSDTASSGKPGTQSGWPRSNPTKRIYDATLLRWVLERLSYNENVITPLEALIQNETEKIPDSQTICDLFDLIKNETLSSSMCNEFVSIAKPDVNVTARAVGDRWRIILEKYRPGVDASLRFDKVQSEFIATVITSDERFLNLYLKGDIRFPEDNRHGEFRGLDMYQVITDKYNARFPNKKRLRNSIYNKIRKILRRMTENQLEHHKCRNPNACLKCLEMMRRRHVRELSSAST